ncbi:MAG: hypothetical protein LBR44_03450 [Clostridiales Family XIII bacterium]|nr:hypothetical protein [Clostridiales Family XIII bacterium]
MGVADLKYIDVDSALARVGGNEGLYKKLLGKFAESVDIAAVDAALAAGRFEEAGQIVHAAKGVAGNLSLTAFFEASETLMDQLRPPVEALPKEEDAAAFKTLYKETVEAINQYLG